MEVVSVEVCRDLPLAHADKADTLTRSLPANVHGHCFFTLNGTFDVIGETDPRKAALDRVNDAQIAFGRTDG
ncbi:hypothetical protein MOK15_12170 [Sphingobium sp. BYY-5]|uniref:hypothetical protein n=1 Tax=Sphingobium sp. BYY-5 TaxID=2926400 RepID=UPI001FA6B42C|nr:hypothetical protein [Sphingobium sp. BYY-5]MCI4590843.1 hypothetical protein [Sphingobium sp. BYY-5]